MTWVKVRKSEVDMLTKAVDEAGTAYQVMKKENQMLKDEVKHLREQNTALTNRLCGKGIILND